MSYSAGPCPGGTCRFKTSLLIIRYACLYICIQTSDYFLPLMGICLNQDADQEADVMVSTARSIASEPVMPLAARSSAASLCEMLYILVPFGFSYLDRFPLLNLAW